MTHKKECSGQKSTMGPQPCEGPLWKCAGYYANGGADYRCERHARFIMTANPLGHRYRPPTAKED